MGALFLTFFFLALSVAVVAMAFAALGFLGFLDTVMRDMGEPSSTSVWLRDAIWPAGFALLGSGLVLFSSGAGWVVCWRYCRDTRAGLGGDGIGLLLLTIGILGAVVSTVGLPPSAVALATLYPSEHAHRLTAQQAASVRLFLPGVTMVVLGLVVALVASLIRLPRAAASV